MTRIVLDLFLHCRQFGCLHRILGSCQCFSFSSKFPKLFQMFVQSSLFLLIYGFCFVFFAFVLIRVMSIGRWVFVLPLVGVVRLSRKKGPFKCYVTQMGVGVGVLGFSEKSVTKV